eukprot:PhF_6_TR19952/c0_g1_i2/m.29067
MRKIGLCIALTCTLIIVIWLFKVLSPKQLSAASIETPTTAEPATQEIRLASLSPPPPPTMEQVQQQQQQTQQTAAPIESALHPPNQNIDPDENKCFHSQFGEDEYLIKDTKLKDIYGGVYVESGGADGYLYSISYYFERFRNWRGTLVDANPHNVAKFNSVYKPLRPRAQFHEVALCSNETRITFVHPDDKTRRHSDHTVSGILETMPKKLKKFVCGKHCDYNTMKECSCKLLRRRCRSICNILKENGVDHVDLWVLDIEGAEYPALQGMFLNPECNIPVWHVLIEVNQNFNEMEAILQSKGFRRTGLLKRSNIVFTNLAFDPSRYKYDTSVQQELKCRK